MHRCGSIVLCRIRALLITYIHLDVEAPFCHAAPFDIAALNSLKPSNVM